jgi:sRNA-binding regulator protein Hfq
MFNLTNRSVRVTIVAVEKLINITYYEMWGCYLRYPVSNAHAPYCHPWPLWLYKSFRHYLLNGTILKKNVTGYKMWVVIFSKTFCPIHFSFWEELSEIWSKLSVRYISHSEKNWARYDQNVLSDTFLILRRTERDMLKTFLSDIFLILRRTERDMIKILSDTFLILRKTERDMIKTFCLIHYSFWEFWERA